MKFIIIRNNKSDKFTMHATTCSVAVKHYSPATLANHENSAPSVAQCLADMAAYAEECGWNEAPKVKICACAKAIS